MAKAWTITGLEQTLTITHLSLLKFKRELLTFLDTIKKTIATTLKALSSSQKFYMKFLILVFYNYLL